MIVTRRWLEEWVDLDGITTDEICRKLNSIGLEVDSVKEVKIPERIVIGRVVSCEKHPDADKLSVCQVDLGSATRQIVCGAKNVRAGIYVPVATVGAVMPDGMKIKHAKLRGVESDGMICSSKEIGLPELGDGILELDESIGKLEIGKELSHYPLLFDTVIEIELTANRGDCLSIHGVARELAVGFGRSLKELDFEENFADQIGIGRILQFVHMGNPPVSLIYHAFDVKGISLPLLMKMRLALIDESVRTSIEGYLKYAIHTSGVVLRDYGFSKIAKGKEKAKLVLKEMEERLAEVECDGDVASIVGLFQNEELKPDEDEKTILLEASYVSPDILAPAVKKLGIETDPLYYRTSRGSEPDLDFGIKVLFSLLKKYSQISIYAGESEYVTSKEPVTVDISLEEIEELVGQKIELSDAVSILARLGFSINKTEDGRIVAKTPLFRHDIENRQDVIEEIVRIVGIDNISSKPLEFTEANRMSDSLRRYRFLREIRLKAVAAGFFETIHYVFCDNERIKKFGFEPIEEEKELLNPITSEMDGLRPSLMVNMLDSLKRNVNISKSRVQIFEIGTIFDSHRDESLQMALAFCGERESDAVVNAGKPKNVDFPYFVSLLSSIIGEFELEECKKLNSLMHPYQSADIIVEDVAVGQVAKLHPKVAEEFDLPDTFFAQIDITSLVPKVAIAEEYASLTPIYRDLSIVVPQSKKYGEIREVLKESTPAIVKRFYPIDRYVDDTLGEDMSLTIRFVIEPYEKSLEESEINAIMEEILKSLENRCSARLR